MKKLIIFSIVLLFCMGGFAVYRFPEPIIESVELKDGIMEIIRSQQIISTNVINQNLNKDPFLTLQYPSILESGRSGGSMPSVKCVWKEIYKAVNGKIVLVETIEAKVTPVQDEKWEFPK